MSSTPSKQRGTSRRSAPAAGRRKGSAPRRTAASTSRTSSKRTAPRPAGPLVPVIVIAVVLVLGWALYPALKLQYQTSRRIGGLEAQYETLRHSNDALRAQVAELKTPTGVENAAREDLGYTKKGEHVYVVMPSHAPSSATQAASVAGGGDERSALQVILDAIFGVSPAPTVDSAP
jgi:cell division protein FtsB